MFINIDVKNKIAVIKVIGDLCTETSSKFNQIINENINDINDIIFDFSELAYLNSTGIGCLLSLKHNNNINIYIFIPERNEPILKIIEMVNLKELFYIFHSLEDTFNFIIKSYNKENLKDLL